VWQLDGIVKGVALKVVRLRRDRPRPPAPLPPAPDAVPQRQPAPRPCARGVAGAAGGGLAPVRPPLPWLLQPRMLQGPEGQLGCGRGVLRFG
jgi:hypothetical protein